MHCVCMSEYFNTPANSVTCHYCQNISQREEILVEIMQLKNAGQKKEGWHQDSCK